TNGHTVPLFFLDTDIEGNDPRDRVLTDHLYGGDERYRLCQEVLLGIGGVAMLRALGHTRINTFHMNEGHSALITVALLEEQVGHGRGASFVESDIQSVRRRCVFTTHTPVPAGHDRIDTGLATDILGDTRASMLRQLGVMNGELNMTELALHFSGFV